MEWSSLLAPEMAPVWAMAGAGATKALDWLAARRRDVGDQAQRALQHVNDATKQVLETLFRTVERLEGEVRKLSEELGQCEDKHAAANLELAELRAAVRALEREARAAHRRA